jgi:hypothetical protein
MNTHTCLSYSIYMYIYTHTETEQKRGQGMLTVLALHAWTTAKTTPHLDAWCIFALK